MNYRTIPNTSHRLSVIGLGGHEFLPNGRSRGFNEDQARAVTPGEIFEGFGGPRRREVLAAAFDAGINFLDVTIDSEKEALGRNLREVRPPHEIYIQTRPEGMCWGYDPGNPKMADLPLLRTEVQRVLKLLGRERLEILNLGFAAEAFQRDPEFLDRLGENIAALKQEGLILLASADTFSGESVYLAAIRSRRFDAIFINFNCYDCGAAVHVLPEARSAGMAINTREVFGKTGVFTVAEQAGITDRNRIARLAIRWNLAQPGVTTAVVGAHDAAQLANSLAALDESEAAEDEQLFEQLTVCPAFTERRHAQVGRFIG